MSEESAESVAAGPVDQLDPPETREAPVAPESSGVSADAAAIEASVGTGVEDAEPAADAISTDASSTDVSSTDVSSTDVSSADAVEGVAPSADEDIETEEEIDPLDEEGDIAADYLEELLDIADLDGDIDTYVEAGRAHVSIVTDSQVLVGADGNVLEALQELARLAVMTETGHRSRLMLDVAGFREGRRKELLILAGEAIASVKETGEPAHLAPMNPFERKIIHDAVAAAGLTSESEGVEPKRHVVVSA